MLGDGDGRTQKDTTEEVKREERKVAYSQAIMVPYDTRLETWRIQNGEEEAAASLMYFPF